MNVGKKVRLNRLFSHPSGRMFAVAVDHFINYRLDTLPAGLRNISRTLELIAAGQPDAVTMHRGLAVSAWQPYAGKIPFILQSSLLRPDDCFHEQIADPEDAVRLGADAFAVATFVRGPSEGHYLKTLADCVKAAARFEMPVITHIYPRKFGADVSISFEPEDVAWAVRCALECGVDVIKVPYCNDLPAYAQIVSECPLPIVAAGGPKADSFEAALTMLQDVVNSGAKGATVGRNVWGLPQITEAVIAVKAVIHGAKNPRDAMKLAGIAP